MASTYEHDKDIALANTSAAESGNSCILRIRKAISYMSQTRAIRYMHAFLSVFNREKRIEMHERR